MDAISGSFIFAWACLADLRFPAWLILPLPQVHGLIISNDMTVDWVTIEHRTRAIRNVTEVAEQRAAVSDFDFCIQIAVLAGSDGINEILNVRLVRIVTFAFVDDFVVLVKDFVAAAAFNFARSFVTVKRDKS